MIKFKKKVGSADNYLKFGDIVFCDDRSTLNLAARMIRYVELGGRSPGKKFVPNHVMMVLYEHPDIDEVVLAQADYNGVKPKKLGLWIKHSKVNIKVRRYPKALTDNEKITMRNYAIQQEHKGYDWLALLGIYLQYLLIKYSKSEWLKTVIKAIQNPFDIANRLICSEFIVLIFRQVKIMLCKHTQPANTTPYDIYQNKKLRDVWQQFNYSYTRGKSNL